MRTGLPGIDLRDPGLPGRVHDAFGALRDTDPLCELGPGRWLATRHDDVAALLKDRVRLGTDLHAVRGYEDARPFGAGTVLERFQERLLINLPAAEHRRVRGAFTAPFTRHRVEADVTALVTRVAGELLDALPDEGEVDWHATVARPLPERVFAALFGLPAAELPQILAWLHEDTVALDVLLDPGLVAPADLERGQGAMLGLWFFVDALARERREAPGEDLLSYLVAAHEAGRLSWDDVLTQAMEALAAGTNTTMTLLSGMLGAFAGERGAWARVRADPALVPLAVEEALRHVSPVLAMGRVVLEDLEVRGRTLRAGDVVQCVVLAANRDPSVFAEPGRFDVARRPNPHVSFGGGAHTCLGAHVARLEARVVLEGALARWSRIEVDPDAAALHPTLMVRTYRRYPVRLVA